jgi:hypothetical protein
LVDEQGIFDFHEVDVKHFSGSLMDLKSFERVQESFVVVGINSYVELYRLKNE